MIRTTLFLLFIILLPLKSQIKVKTGIEILKDINFEPLKDARVGLISNPTGVDSKLKSTVDILYEAENVNLVALFAPEHGIRGSNSAGEYVESYIDEYTKLPVYSLYGKSRKPSSEMLKNIDILLYDIQDIGCRSYTYISTMGMAMEAAAENGIKFVILDRPNPLGGLLVEGNLVEDKYISFVSQFKIPYIYGLTAGELANYINNEILKPKGKDCDLLVIKMKGWKRNMIFSETGLPWVPTSPHIPHSETAFYYAISGIVGELNVISIGVGYTIPFETFAAPWINGKQLADLMNSYNLPGVIFRPITYKPYYGVYKGEMINGVHCYITDYKNIRPVEIQFYFLQAHHQLYPDKNVFELSDVNRLKMFDKVCGTDRIRKLLNGNFSVESINEIFNRGVKEFEEKSKKYYLYD